METSHENKQVVKVLNALIDGRKQIGVEKFPIALVNISHFEIEKMSPNEGYEILHHLVDKNYLRILTDEELQECEDDFNMAMDKLFDHMIKTHQKTEQEVNEGIQKMLKKFGYDTESDEFKYSEKEYTELTDYKKSISNTLIEKKLKSPEVEKYMITDNLFKLREYLRRGRDFYNLEKKLVEYDSDNFILHIGTERINIKPTETTPLGHYILKYIIETDIKDTYSADDLSDRDILHVEHRGNLKLYTDAVRSLNKKIKKETDNRISDFFKVTKDSIKIKDKYTL